jgi:hypothetical protein
MLVPRPETTERLQIVDERGTAIGRVNLPSDPRLFGAEKGTVYLERQVPALPAPGPRPHAA